MFSNHSKECGFGLVMGLGIGGIMLLLPFSIERNFRGGYVPGLAVCALSLVFSIRGNCRMRRRWRAEFRSLLETVPEEALGH